MDTKLNPDPNSCHERAEPDEPRFTLLARDPAAPLAIEDWCAHRARMIRHGQKPESDWPMIFEARCGAAKMVEWRHAHRPQLDADHAPSTHAGPHLTERDLRQIGLHNWAIAAFSAAQALSLPQRGIRLLEEVLEAAQAAESDPELDWYVFMLMAKAMGAYRGAGGHAAMAHDLIDFVFGRPPGELRQELGGVAVCTLLLAAAAGVSADEAERAEIARILAKPLEHFTQRNAAKNEAGFNHVGSEA